jgi:peptidoglycan/xylan/chitin deacetylase (PgdA/CDA1 family)
MVGCALLLGGCAAGSPSIVAPAAPDTAGALVAQAPDAPPTIPGPEPTAPPTATVAIVAPPPPTETPAPADPPAAPTAPGNDAVAFAQSVPTVPSAQGQTAPANDPPPASEPAGAQVAPTPRPPAPPDPGTGMTALFDGAGTNDRLEVALTFDAGADTGDAAQILDILQQQGIHATIGMTGQWAQANPDLLRRMVAEGHQLINHTWDHPSLTGANTGQPPMTPDQVAQELGDTEAIVRDTTGYELRPYFRPPYGDYDDTSLGYVYDSGYTVAVMWTCDSHGWAGWDAQKIVDYCTTNIKPHEIILMHLGAAAATDLEALPAVIQFFRDNGYAFVTVEQMLQP